MNHYAATATDLVLVLGDTKVGEFHVEAAPRGWLGRLLHRLVPCYITVSWTELEQRKGPR